MADDEVSVRIGIDNSGVASGVEETKDQLDEVGDKGDDLGEKFTEMGELIAEAFAVEKIIEFIDHLEEVGEQAERTARMLGETVEEVQQFQGEVELSGGSADSAAMSMQRLERNMANATAKAGPQRAAFQAVGVSMEDLKNKSPHEILLQIADDYQTTADGANKVANAIAIGGRGFAQMIPTLDQGSKGLKDYDDQLNATGSIMSKELAESFAQAHRDTILFEKSLEGAGESIVSVFMPAIDDLLKALTAAAEAFTNATKGEGDLAGAMQHLGSAIKGLVFVIDTVVTAIRELYEVAMAGFEGIYDAFDVCWKKMLANMHPFNQQMQDQYHAALSNMEQNTHERTQAMAEIWDGYYKRTEDANQKHWGTILNQDEVAALKIKNAQYLAMGANTKTGEPNKPDIGSPSSGGDEISQEDQIAIQDAQTQIQLGKLVTEAKKEEWQQQVDAHQITMQQMQSNEKAAVQQELEDTLAELQLEADAYDKNAVKYDEIQNKMVLAKKQAALEMQKIDEQSTKTSEKAYDGFFKTINSGLDEMIRGVLQGTQTWQQMMGRLFDNLALKFLDDVVIKPVEAWAQGQLQMILANEAKNAAITTSDTAAAGAGQAAQAVAAKGSITTSASQAAAAVYADVAAIPYVGWLLAPPAAAAAFVAVEAFGGSIPSAAGGMVVGEDMLAQVHEDEMVLPANITQPLLGMIGAGQGGVSQGSANGDTYHITVQAIDTQSGMQFLRANMPTIVKGLQTASRNGSNAMTQHVKAS